MKKIALLCIAIAGVITARAQIFQTAYKRCGIYYDYDATGNRVKRYNDCQLFDPNNLGGTTNPLPGGGAISRMAGTDNDDNNDVSLITIYPNPANDFVNIRLSETAEHVHFHLYDGKGSIVQAGDISGQEYRCNLGALAPGLYHLNILYQGKPYSFKITKL
ncbi:T9SS type A sorting domain-containing protein [Taibaiella soli]|uniref:Secretion system C-terminal sorting domain-containing protein n=1 Tax=Taibaiella soli TaxID=1649169 RepID=A0A2W2B3I5_9BACT|nr:T9SS type A sorting domain-containing protein [Taibaiella soli]PZF74854.1 hypothetical protein DN068_01260 [Taibaiella soli]